MQLHFAQVVINSHGGRGAYTHRRTHTHTHTLILLDKRNRVHGNLWLAHAFLTRKSEVNEKNHYCQNQPHPWVVYHQVCYYST